MGWNVDLKDYELICHSDADTREAHRIATELFAGDGGHDFQFEMVLPDAEGQKSGLTVDEYQGDHYDRDATQGLFLALAPHMADRSYVQFGDDSGDVWRYIWLGGRVYLQDAQTVVWGEPFEVTPPAEETPKKKRSVTTIETRITATGGAK